ncbi:hypothetical protein E5Q_01304 [Mixia osmundae IAM 14324]|uniref:Uncharacterized protein n=2 Tax=Mixia osmundae (strain CBS 9802 / IAM 14324 / JCM 22182 / KY 12970) TaxID=764103 RepID=G7DVP1_MIXOS|nr:hypothetical protein E5Q_01304 [Mixia osmundae IAM 14324]
MYHQALALPLQFPYGWYAIDVQLIDAKCKVPGGERDVTTILQWTVDAGFNRKNELTVQYQEQPGLIYEAWPTTNEPMTGQPYALLRVTRARRLRMTKPSRDPVLRCCRVTWIQDVFLWQMQVASVKGDASVFMTCADDDVPDECQTLFPREPVTCEGTAEAKSEHVI